MDNEETHEIKLDGSIGFGDKAYVTIITKDGAEEKEETFQFPYVLIRTEIMQKYLDLKLITGFKVIREIEAR